MHLKCISLQFRYHSILKAVMVFFIYVINTSNILETYFKDKITVCAQNLLVP